MAKKKKRAGDPTAGTSAKKHNARNSPGSEKNTNQIKVSNNKFKALSSDSESEENKMEMEEETSMNEECSPAEQKTNKIKIPPIVVASKDFSAKPRTDIVKDVTSKFKGTLINYTLEKITILSNSQEAHNNIKDLLTKAELEFHTYAGEAEKEKKFVIRGLPPIEISEIHEEIKAHGLTASKISKMKTGKDAPDGHPLYYVSFKHTEKVGQINNIRYICSVRVKWERYKNKRRLTQCYCCQGFGHGASFCYNTPRCVRCAENHLTKNCKKQEGTPPECANCHQNHAANSTDCAAYKKRIELIDKKKNRAAPPRQQPPQRNEINFPLLQPRGDRNGGEDNSRAPGQRREQTTTNNYAPTPLKDPAATKDAPELDSENNNNNYIHPEAEKNSYAEAATQAKNIIGKNQTSAASDDINSIFEVIKEFKILNTLCNVKEMLMMIRELNNKLKYCTDHITRCEAFY